MAIHKPSKSFDNPFLGEDDGLDEEVQSISSLPKNKNNALPEIPGSTTSNQLPDVALPDIEDELSSDVDESAGSSDAILPDLFDDEESDEIIATENTQEEDDEDDIMLFEDDEDEDDFDDDNIDPGVLQYLQEVDPSMFQDDGSPESDDSLEDWFVDDVSQDDEKDTDEGFSFDPLPTQEEEEEVTIPLDSENINEEAAPNDDSAPEESQIDEEGLDDESKTSETKPSFVDKMKAKLSQISEDVKSEIGDGSGKKKSKKPEEEDNSEDELQEDAENSEDTDGFLGTVKNGFTKINDIFFNALLSFLRLLSKIPVIGKHVRPALNAVNLLRKLASFVPILLILGIWLLLNIFYVNSSEVHELPDEAEVRVENMSFDKDNNTLTADFANIGGVIVDTRADFKVYSTQLTWNPFSIFLPKEVTQCSSEWVTVEQDDIETVEAPCEDNENKGFWFRGSIEVVE